MTQIIVLAFAIIVPVVIAILILRAWKKYDKQDFDFPENRDDENTLQDKNQSN